MAIFYTSDWHLNGTRLIDLKLRPFKSIEKMNKYIITGANQRAKTKNDIIIHLGDFLQYGDAAGTTGVKVKPHFFIDQIESNFINIEGNHDSNNRVPFIGKSIRTTLGKRFPNVSCCHYPSTDIRAKGHFAPFGIHLHGHSHNGVAGNGEIFHIDHKNKVLNVNVCVDLWKYRIISQDELIQAIIKFMKQNDASHIFKNL